jgi:hypothetical protein
MSPFTREQLHKLAGATQAKPSSQAEFTGGGQYRIEIPSVEGAAAFDAVIEEASRLGVPLHRVSQGSGITLLRDDEITEIAKLGQQHNIEVCLFAGPRAPWEGTAASRTPDGKYVGWRHTTVAQLDYAYADVVRAAELGIRSVLAADEGLISLVHSARAAGELPADLIVKASAIMGIANPFGAKLLEQQGADTLNVVSDTPVGELAAFRALCTVPLDLYIESPDNLGGALRYHELPEIVRVAAPVHLKFGLANAPNIYPSGHHLEHAAIATGRERVRRAAAGLEQLNRGSADAAMAPVAGHRPGLPVTG